MPWTGLVEFNLLTIIPVEVPGAHFFNFFATLVFATSIPAFVFGAIAKMIQRA